MEEYIIAEEMNTEEIVLITSNEYNVFKYEPITGSDNREEAERLLSEVKRLGVSKYLDKIISESCLNKKPEKSGMGDTMILGIKGEGKSVSVKIINPEDEYLALINSGKDVDHEISNR